MTAPRKLPYRKSRLGGAVGVRFQPEMIERVKPIADAEGLTVSTWIRREVDRAVSSRGPRPVTITNTNTDPARMAREMSRMTVSGVDVTARPYPNVRVDTMRGTIEIDEEDDA